MRPTLTGVLLMMLHTEIAALRERLAKAGIEREAKLETKLEQLEHLERDVRRVTRPGNETAGTMLLYRP